MYFLVEGPAFAIAEMNPTTERARPILFVVYRPLSWICTAIGGPSPADPPWKFVRAYEKFWRDVRDAITGYR